MTFHPFLVLAFGNLLFFIIEKQLSIFYDQNIYVPASLFLNLILLLEIRKVAIMPPTYYLFIFASLFGVISSFYLINSQDFLAVAIKYIWIVSGVLLINHLIKFNTAEFIIEQMTKFSFFVGSLIVINAFLTVVLIDDPYALNEGLKSILISSDNAKKIGLLSLPFLLLSTWKHKLIGVLVLLYLVLGTRAMILASLFTFLFSSLIYIRPSSVGSRNKMTGIFFVTLILVSSIFLISSTRTIDFTNFISSIDRVVKWSQYSRVIIDYPLGLGPEGAFYLLREDPKREGIDLSPAVRLLMDRELTLDTERTVDELVEKRISINTNLQAKSSENLFLDFISSYGILGLILTLHLFTILLKDIKLAASFRETNFSTIYISLAGTLVYGLFNSFHSGMLFIMILYFIYLESRKETYKIIKI